MARDDSVALALALEEIKKLTEENTRLRTLLDLDRPLLALPASGWEPTLFGDADKPETVAVPRDGSSSSLSRADKVALFRSLFVGREDVHALRWENSSGKSGWSPAVKGGWAKLGTPDASTCS